MSRTNDVNIAMQYAKSGVDGVHLMDSHKATIGWVVNTLAAEVERLEKRENELINALDMGQINCDAVYDELREERDDARARAEAAEARVKELKLKLVRQDEVAEDYEATVWKYGQERMELRAQNARLRGTLMRVTGSLGLVLKGAGIAAPAHKENYDAAKKLIEETFSGDREEAST